MIIKPEGEWKTLYDIAVAWDKITHRSELYKYPILEDVVNPDFEFDYQDMKSHNKWDQAVLDKALLNIDFTPLVKLSLMRRSYNDSRYSRPTKLHENFTSGIFSEEKGNDSISVYLGDHYEQKALIDYEGVSVRIDGAKEGVSFIRVYNPKVSDEENYPCVLADMRIAGMQTSKDGALILEGHMIDSSFWTELPDYTQDPAPYCPSSLQSEVVVTGKVRIIIFSC